MSRRAVLEEQLRTEQEMARRRAKAGLLGFACYTKPDYQVNWHHKVIARHLNLVAQGKLKRLIICQPPRTGKSELVSTRFPAYLLGVNPQHQIIAASYNSILSSKMSRSVQRVIDGKEYRQVFEGTRLGGPQNKGGQGTKWRRTNDEFEVVGHGGFYFSTGVGGAATGYGMTVGIIDDPTKNREEANSPTYRERTWDWYTSTFYSRLEKDGAIIVCATRWHEDDLIGRLIKQSESGEDSEDEAWTVLRFPSTCEVGKHPDDPRALGEALWPEKYPVRRLERMKTVMGSRDWASLHQQRPSQEGGGIVKDAWWQYYDKLPGNLTDYTLSVDLPYDDLGDYACYQVWAAQGADRYLVDMVMRREGFTEQCDTFKMLARKWPQARTKLVEKAANGAALIAHLKKLIPGIIPVIPLGSKENRAQAVAPQIESGNVYLPQPAKAPWVTPFLEQWNVFPNGQHDDAVDACSQALSRMEKKSPVGGGGPAGSQKQSHWNTGVAAAGRRARPR